MLLRSFSFRLQQIDLNDRAKSREKTGREIDHANSH